MPGFSLTLLLLPGSSEPNAPSAEKILALLDEPASVPGWKWTAGKPPAETAIAPQVGETIALGGQDAKLKAADDKAFVDAIVRAANSIIKEEPEITRMDNIAGDGDCGLTLKGGAEGKSGYGESVKIALMIILFVIAVIADIQSGRISGQNVVQSVIAISKIAEEQMGGTSGAIYSSVVLVLLAV